ncbi:MAG TPA: putative glycoside hydrolase [bacterium]|nr:putative glycoside hydrolase [bacterium]
MRTLLAVVTLALLIPCMAAAQSTDLTRIPKWLAESETYGFGINDLDEVNGTSWKFITHCPRSKEFLGEARRRGIRAFPYVTFYQASLFATEYEFRLAEHPDWILIDPNGQWMRTGFWESEDAKNMYCVCPNTKGYADALLDYLEELMKRGAGGIFLDNLHPKKECFGPQFGKHEHLFKTQFEAFADLMRRAKEIIRKYDPEGALLVNSADPASLPGEFWPWADADMSESFICTWVSDKRWGDWQKNWNGIDKKIPEGKQVCALSYVGHTTNPVKDDLYFAYASARLMNFIWNAGGESHIGKNTDMDALYALTLGQPVGPETVTDEVHYRRFAHGIVAVNPTDHERTIELKEGLRTSFLKDHYAAEEIPVENGRISLTIPPQSGRVYSYKASNATDFTQDSHHLIVKTEPGLGKTCFELDGLFMMTYSGGWKIEYEKGSNYGTFHATFSKPGLHTLRILDLERKDMLVANSYGDAYALNDAKMPGATGEDKREFSNIATLKDPADPNRPASGKVYKFIGWGGAVESTEQTIEVYVEGTTTVTARYAAE